MRCLRGSRLDSSGLRARRAGCGGLGCVSAQSEWRWEWTRGRCERRWSRGVHDRVSLCCHVFCVAGLSGGSGSPRRCQTYSPATSVLSWRSVSTPLDPTTLRPYDPTTRRTAVVERCSTGTPSRSPAPASAATWRPLLVRRKSRSAHTLLRRVGRACLPQYAGFPASTRRRARRTPEPRSPALGNA